MNRNNGSGLNVQWRSCLSIICLREKIETPPTDYAVSIMALHMLLCGMDSGMTVSLYTSWGFIFWLIYSSDHYSQSTALVWLSHWAIITKLENPKFPHSIALTSLWHWYHNFREGWNNTQFPISCPVHRGRASCPVCPSSCTSAKHWALSGPLSREPDLPHRYCHLLLASTARTSQDQVFSTTSIRLWYGLVKCWSVKLGLI